MMEYQDLATRFWDDLVSRPSGPMAFRFVLQPVMAVIFATRDGIKDARTGRSPYFWTILSSSGERGGRIREGLKAVGRIILLGLAMDAIYQFRELDGFRPLEAVVVALVLGFIPYLLMRGPIARLAKHWLARRHAE
ncbi:MAG TPA: hypothetical protein VGO34_15200 [Alphaproteobacteria bacterium]|jgi:hypothetical protein